MGIAMNPAWGTLLLAREKTKVPGAAGRPVRARSRLDATFSFPLLAEAIGQLAASGAGGKLAERAQERIASLLPTYAQIVQLQAEGNGPGAVDGWGNTLPRFFLMLVSDKFKTVEAVLENPQADADEESLLTLFNALRALEAGQDMSSLAFPVSLLGVSPLALASVQSWVMIEPVIAGAETGLRLLLPALLDTPSLARVTLSMHANDAEKLSPASMVNFHIDDPKTLAPLCTKPGVRLAAAIGAGFLEVPVPVLWSELTLAVNALRRYRINAASEVSLWDQALLLDPPAAMGAGAAGDFGTRYGVLRTAFYQRLRALSTRGGGLFGQLSFDILTAACWARRLEGIAANGLTYPGGPQQDPRELPPLPGAAPALAAGGALAADDGAADGADGMTTVPASAALLCAFYLSVRLGAAATSSARSLDALSDEDASLGVAGLLLDAELVATDAVRQIAHRMDNDDATSSLASWIGGVAPPNAQAGRGLIGIDVIRLGAEVKDVAATDIFDDVAQTRPHPAAYNLDSPATHRALVRLLVDAGRDHQAGGMPAFIQRMVANGINVGGGAPPATAPDPLPEQGAAPAPALVRLLEKRFPSWVSWALTERAANPLPDQHQLPMALRGARDIVRMGRGGFIERFVSPDGRLNAALLGRIYSHAWTKVDARAHFIAKIGTQKSPAPAGSVETPGEEGDLPDLAGLFGLADLPSCSWGASVHGPAAYLADTLEFLRHRRMVPRDPSRKEPSSALKQLLKRRRDLAEIDLTEANAVVEMPFIDLVCEVLEQRLAKSAYTLPLQAFQWRPQVTQELDERVLAPLRSALEPWGIALRTPVMAAAVAPAGDAHAACRTETWMLRDCNGIALRLSRHVDDGTAPEWSARLAPQTTLGAAALAAEPQYVGRQGYARLARESTAGSFTLPWSLGEAQAAQLLELVDLDLATLLRAATPEQEDGPYGAQAAAASLGIPVLQGSRLVFDEGSTDLLLGPAPGGDAGPVTLRALLAWSGLAFDDVRALEQSHAFGDAGFALVPADGNACSADAGAITVQWGQGSDVRSRMGRFLRLRKALGWSVAELDLALTAHNIGAGKMDPQFALHLAQLEAVRTKLGVSLPQLLRIFTRLRTTPLGHAAAGDWAAVFTDPRSTGADVFQDQEALAILRRLGGDASLTIGGLLGTHHGASPLAARIKALVAAAVRLPEAELDGLVALRLGATARWTGCNREELAQLHGAAVLMHALGTDFAQFAALAALSGEHVFEDPARCLALCTLKARIEAAGIDAAGLHACLAGPAEADSEGAAPAYGGEHAMAGLLALYAALRPLSAVPNGALLPEGPAQAAAGAQWEQYLRDTGNDPAAATSALQKLELLREPVRRVLPQVLADVPTLLQARTASFEAGKHVCEGSVPLLADRLQQAAHELGRVLPEDPALAGPARAAWMMDVYGPLLQWAGLNPGEIAQRLQLAAEPAQGLLQASYLLCRPLVRRVLMKQRQAAVAETVAATLGSNAAQAWSLLAALPSGNGGNAASELALLEATDEQGPWLGPVALALEQAARVPALAAAFAHVQCAARAWYAIGPLKLDAAAIDWLESAVPGAQERVVTRLGGLAVASLAAPADVVMLAQRWGQLARWSEVLQQVPDQAAGPAGARVSLKTCVLDVLLAPPDLARIATACWAALLQALQRLLNMPAAQLDGILDAAAAQRLLEPQTYAWLRDAGQCMRSTGLSPAQLRALASAMAGADEPARLAAAGALRSSLRPRFTDASWPQAVQAGQDKLRVHKRDALVDCLLGDPDLAHLDGSADLLYEHLLLDTQMAPGMTTSRIVQAHAAVQQFAQRCLMGLEQGWRISPDERGDWKQWSWMRNYRVWESCRKIFLYPENWMEPEVRDDKSPFFEELENDLNQGEPSNENAEQAFIRYLHKLHDVARLEVLATYYEFDPALPVMHILARTPAEPRRYFYRQWIDERRWTPWELVDLEIDSSQVLLYKRAGRLFIAWMTAICEEKRPEAPSAITSTKTVVSAATETFQVGGADTEPSVRWKLQLTTSEKANEGWQPKRVSPDFLLWPKKQYVRMSEFADDYALQRVQLVYQDFGVPEILVFKVGKMQQDNRTDPNASAHKQQIGSFLLASCQGIGQAEPVLQDSYPAIDIYPVMDVAEFEGFRYRELERGSKDRFNLIEGTGARAEGGSVLESTPGRFSVTLANQASILDLALAVARAALVPTTSALPMTMGLGLPMFYADDTVDLALRVNFNPPAADGTAGGAKQERPMTSRRFARILGSLRMALASEAVQDLLWTEGAAPDAILDAVAREAPDAAPAQLVALLRAVSGPYPDHGPFELAARMHHPLACELVRRAEALGVQHVFSQALQMTPTGKVYRGRATTGLSEAAIAQFGTYALSFDEERDAYAGYNWEVFFHAPFMIALRFAAEARFDDALRWFHYIFDPAGGGAGAARQACWKTQPFHAQGDGAGHSQRIDVLIDPAAWQSPEGQAALEALAESITAWRERPNLPFQVGRGRWVAFQKAVVYRYIDTLLAAADARFRIDSREEITAASQLYVLAARLLGGRPRTDIAMCNGAGQACSAQSYEQLRELIDQRDDALSAHLDSLLGEVKDISDCRSNEEPDSPHLNFYNEYFCVPPNEKLFDLWDRVADRLFKIRHCQNIDGVVRSLALFAPPIDPALLARAGAAGMGFEEVMAGMNQARPHYRFATMLQKANEAAGELRNLGSELMAALEKRDAEELSLLRSRLELHAVRLNREVRDQLVKDAETQIAALTVQMQNSIARRDWYVERVARGASGKELEAIDGIRGGLLVRTRVAAMKSIAAVAAMIPKITLGGNGALGSPHFALTIAGECVANAQNYFADKLAVEGDKDQTAASITATLAGYERRKEDWELQRDVAAGELRLLERQAAGAAIRLAIAQAERRNLENAIENAEATDAFIKGKFTNAKLYDWMVRQVSGVYFKTYQLAHDLALAAENCLNHELPLSQRGVRTIQPGYWDGLRKGLLAATGLIHDLKRLENEHTKRNKRLPELTKHVALSVVDPLKLLELQATGSCVFTVPESLFDLDHPGQYARRIRSVSLSVPCVAGPYTALSCKLTLVESALRVKDARAADLRQDEALQRSAGPAEAIFTSSANGDSGMWEANLHDERYLPFEGAGAVNSVWRVELPALVRQFNYATISDVVLEIRYSAEASSDAAAAEKNLAKILAKQEQSPLWAYTSLRSDLPDDFNALRKGGRSEALRLHLPSGLGKWMGLPLKADGSMIVVLVGTPSAAGGKIAVEAASKPAAATFDAGPYLSASFDGLASNALFGDKGFSLDVSGMEALDDVLIFVKGTTTAPAP